MAQQKNSKPVQPVQIDFRKITGKWKNVKITPNLHPSSAATKQPATSTGTDKKAETPEESGKIARNDKSKYIDLNAASRMLNKSIIEFVNEKNATITRDTITQKYTWKKSKKNVVTLSNQVTKAKTNLQVVKLTNDSLQFIVNLSASTMDVVFVKEK